jgi:rhodanese-related sulfurtransferase
VKFLIDTWYYFAAALVSGGMLIWPLLKRGGPAGGVTCSDAVQLINREKAVVIDVRDAAEFAAGHIVNSKNLGLATLETSALLPKNKNLPLVVVCNTGSTATRATAVLKKMGFDKTSCLAGGLNAWRQANYPLEKKD